MSDTRGLKALLDEKARQWLAVHSEDDPAGLALRYAGKKELPYTLLVQQIAARQKARQKLPGWYERPGILFPPPPALEQCSSEFTAAYKSKHFKAQRPADLTGGMGVDAVALAREAEALLFLEPDADRLEYARHNLQIWGLKGLTLRNIRAEEAIPLIADFRPDLIYLDPSRRDTNNRRSTLLNTLSPDVTRLQDELLELCPHVLVKAGPMLDISAALKELHSVSEVHVLSVQNECRELLFLLERGHTGPVEIICAELGSGGETIFRYHPQEEKNAEAEYTEAGRYLYDPFAALTKAGALRLPAVRFQAGKLHANTHVYTSNELIIDFPGRIFRLKKLLPFDKQLLQDHTEGGKATILLRNFPVKSEEVDKTLRFRSSADTWIILYRDYAENLRAAVCERIS